MSGFWERMAARATGTEQALQPRRPEPFEPLAGTLTGVRRPAGAAAPWPPPERGKTTAEPVEERWATEPLPEREPQRAPAGNHPARPLPPPRPQRHAPPRQEADGGDASDPPERTSSTPAATPPATRAARTARPARRAAARADDLVEAVAQEADDRDGPTAPAAPRRTPVAARSTPAPDLRPPPTDPPPTAPPRDAAPGDLGAVDVTAVLRDQVMALLRARALVGARERPVTRPDGTALDAPPEPGTVVVQPGPMTVQPISAEARAGRRPRTVDSGPPRVDVRVDRVVVTRAPAPAPTAPRPRRTTVDHDAYLSRRRDGR